MACPKQRATPPSNNPGGVLFNYFDLIWAWDWASWLPAIFSWMTITHLAWKIQTAVVDAWAARAYKTEFHLTVGVWHIQIYLERQVDTAYRKVWWTHMAWLWGLWIWMHKQYFRLVQVKARKRPGSDQLESDNSHEHALKLIDIECKHE